MRYADMLFVNSHNHPAAKSLKQRRNPTRDPRNSAVLLGAFFVECLFLVQPEAHPQMLSQLLLVPCATLDGSMFVSFGLHLGSSWVLAVAPIACTKNLRWELVKIRVTFCRGLPITRTTVCWGPYLLGPPFLWKLPYPSPLTKKQISCKGKFGNTPNNYRQNCARYFRAILS